MGHSGKGHNLGQIAVVRLGLRGYGIVSWLVEWTTWAGLDWFPPPGPARSVSRCPGGEPSSLPPCLPTPARSGSS